MSNSSLVSYVRKSPNHYNGRAYRITKITPHHMAGNLTVEQCGSIFANSSRQASSNYGIGSDGRIGLYVDESNASWASSNWDNDNRAVTIEVANSSTGGNWPVSDAAWNSLVALCVDICRRNGIKGLSWTGSADGTLTCHYMFAPTACPGPYLKSRMGELAKTVNEKLGNGWNPSAPTTTPSGKSLGKVNVSYALKTDGGWLDTVTNFENSTSEGFAGYPFKKHYGFWAKTDKGSIRYKVHTVGSDWTGWYRDGQKIETSSPIDGITCYFETPSGYNYQQAYYRSQTTDRSGWLAVCCDDGIDIPGFDGWAGMYGEPMDRFQLAIAGGNPF